MDDYAVIVSGVQQMLEPYADRVRVVELVSLLPVESDVDVLLYDTYSHERVPGPAGAGHRGDRRQGRPLHLAPRGRRSSQEALAKGAQRRACPSRCRAEELVDALERVHRGDVVVSEDPGPDAPRHPEGLAGQGARPQPPGV